MITVREGSRRFFLVPEKPEQPPEGRLIAEALHSAEPKMTQRQAARLAGMSEARWRQLVSGYQSMGNNYYAPVTAKASTLARMAAIVGVTAEELRKVGRGDAAEEMARQQADSPETVPVGTGIDPADLASLTPEDIEAVKQVIRALRSARKEH